jgi:hypothetical protein
VIVAATIGNVLEWFDFLIYGFFAVTISEVFFPTGNPTVSLLITFGTFGLAYLMRAGKDIAVSALHRGRDFAPARKKLARGGVRRDHRATNKGTRAGRQRYSS